MRSINLGLYAAARVDSGLSVEEDVQLLILRLLKVTHCLKKISFGDIVNYGQLSDALV